MYFLTIEMSVPGEREERDDEEVVILLPTSLRLPSMSGPQFHLGLIHAQGTGHASTLGPDQGRMISLGSQCYLGNAGFHLGHRVHVVHKEAFVVVHMSTEEHDERRDRRSWYTRLTPYKNGLLAERAHRFLYRRVTSEIKRNLLVVIHIIHTLFISLHSVHLALSLFLPEQAIPRFCDRCS